jgi:hypothetical protein
LGWEQQDKVMLAAYQTRFSLRVVEVALALLVVVALITYLAVMAELACVQLLLEAECFTLVALAAALVAAVTPRVNLAVLVGVVAEAKGLTTLVLGQLQGLLTLVAVAVAAGNYQVLEPQEALVLSSSATRNSTHPQHW